MNDIKDLAILLSPLVAVLVAAATIWFNARDRKRHYALEREKLTLEREKLARDMTKALLAGSRTLDKRIDLYNEMFAYISSIAHEARTALNSLAKTGDTNWRQARTTDSLDGLVAKARSSQVFTTDFVHKTITREYASKIARLGSELEGVLSGTSDDRRDAAVNRLTQILQASDELKYSLHDDLEVYVRGLANVSLNRIEEA